MGLPAVVLYRMSALSYLVGRLLVDVPRFSLPNILLGETFETELLQDAVQPERIAAAMSISVSRDRKPISVFFSATHGPFLPFCSWPGCR